MRCAVRRLARRKHGQTAWSPNASSHGASPPMGATAQEMLQLVYRPLPMADTVEYEEDFGHNLLLQRECIPRAYRRQLSHAISGLAYSDTELRDARSQLAQTMNRERAAAHISPATAHDTRDAVHHDVDVDDTTRQVRSARYLFDENRMQYCDRFQAFFRAHHARMMQPQPQQHGQQTNSDDNDATAAAAATPPPPATTTDDDDDDGLLYFSLMEACAVVYGCATTQAREAYMHQFLGLDLDTLEADEAALRECAAEAARVQAQLTPTPSDRTSAREVATTTSSSKTELQAVQAIIDAVPPIFDTTNTSAVTTQGAAAAADNKSDDNTRGGSIAATLPDEFAEYGSLYATYLAHARGDSPVASYDTSVISAATSLAQRRRWRHIIETLVREQYTALGVDELREAAVLNAQLHTVKFAGLKVGDTVREIVQLLQRETGDGSSVHRDTPYAMSPAHPERRSPS